MPIAPAELPHGPSPSLVEGKASPLVGLPAPPLSSAGGSRRLNPRPARGSAMGQMRVACLDIVRDLQRLVVALMDCDPFDPADKIVGFAHDNDGLGLAAERVEHADEVGALQGVAVPGLA